MAIRPLLSALVLAVPLGAAAQELTFEVTGIPAQSETQGYVGLDGCTSGIADTLSFTGSVSNEADTYDLRISFVADVSTPCTRAELAGCNQSVTSSAGDACGCLIESTTPSVALTTSIDAFWSQVCADAVAGTDRKLTFFLQYYAAGVDDIADVEKNADDVFVVNFDFTAPSAPDTAPTVTAGDGALTVSFDTIDGEEYEACATPSGSTESAERCVSANDGSGRVEGLSNDSRYSAYYRAVDKAGNRSASSPAVESAPIEIRDFAEEYARWDSGERGGCDVAADQRGLPTFWIAGLLGIALLRTRRRRDQIERTR